MRTIFIILLVLVPIMQVSADSIDISPLEVVVVNGSQILEQNTSLISKLDYEPNMVIIGEIVVHTDEPDQLDPAMTLQLDFRQNDPENHAIASTKTQAITNGSVLRFAKEITLNFASELYVFVLVEGEINLFINLEYSFRLLETTEIIVDPHHSHQFETTAYPSKLTMQNTFWYNQKKTTLVLPSFSNNGQSLAQLYPAMSYEILVEVQVLEITESASIQLEYGSISSGKTSISEKGRYFLDIASIPHEKIIDLDIVHSGSALELEIRSLTLKLEALETEHNDNPVNSRTAEILAVGLTILAYKVTMILRKKEDS